MLDDVVSVDVPYNIMKICSSKNIQIKLLKNSAHRLSAKKDIEVIINSISELL